MFAVLVELSFSAQSSAPRCVFTSSCQTVCSNSGLFVSSVCSVQVRAKLLEPKIGASVPFQASCCGFFFFFFGGDKTNRGEEVITKTAEVLLS